METVFLALKSHGEYAFISHLMSPFLPPLPTQGYGILKLDVKTKSQNGVVSTAAVSLCASSFTFRRLPLCTAWSSWTQRVQASSWPIAALNMSECIYSLTASALPLRPPTSLLFAVCLSSGMLHHGYSDSLCVFAWCSVALEMI